MKSLLILLSVFVSTYSYASIIISGEFESKVEQQSGASYVEHDLDLTLKANSKGSSVTLMLEDIGRDIDFDGSADYEINATQVFVETDLEGVSFKAGQYEATNGNGIINAASNSNKINLSTTIAKTVVSVTTGDADKNSSVDLTGNIAGLNINVQDVLNSTRFVTVSGDIAGVSVSVERQKTPVGTNTGFNVHKEIGEYFFEYENVKIGDATEVTQYNGFLDNIMSATDKASGFAITAATALGDIRFKQVNIDHIHTNSVKLYRGNVQYKWEKTENEARKIYVKVKVKF